MTKLTANEAKFLESIAFDEMNPVNGAMPDSADDVHCYLWLDERADHMGINVRQARGVLTSLKKKGLVKTVNEKDPNDSGVMMTEEGYAAFSAGLANGTIKDLSW